MAHNWKANGRLSKTYDLKTCCERPSSGLELPAPIVASELDVGGWPQKFSGYVRRRVLLR